MQYGSIGWSVGALLGYAQGANTKRVIACIGDGSFQVKFHCLIISLLQFDDGWLDSNVTVSWGNLAGYSTGCVNYAAVPAEQHNFPDQQWWVHH